MLSQDDIADLEGEAAAWLREAKMDDAVPRMVELCRELLKTEPVRTPDIDRESKLVHDNDGLPRVLLRMDVPPRRARWLVGHEIAEWAHARTDYRGGDIEERCDAMGAMLCAPRNLFRDAIRKLGRHAVHQLAEIFSTTQSLCLLRIGEVTGRPVALLRWPENIFRGDPFEWPSFSTLRRAIEEGREMVHPCTINDEPNRIGLMARWGWSVSD